MNSEAIREFGTMVGCIFEDTICRIHEDTVSDKYSIDTRNCWINEDIPSTTFGIFSGDDNEDFITSKIINIRIYLNIFTLSKDDFLPRGRWRSRDGQKRAQCSR